MKNIFLEKLYAKCGEETSPRLFFKKLKLSMFLDQQPEYLYSLFSLYFQVEHSGADSGLVKLVEMTNFFFNN